MASQHRIGFILVTLYLYNWIIDLLRNLAAKQEFNHFHFYVISYSKCSPKYIYAILLLLSGIITIILCPSSTQFYIGNFFNHFSFCRSFCRYNCIISRRHLTTTNLIYIMPFTNPRMLYRVMGKKSSCHEQFYT